MEELKVNKINALKAWNKADAKGKAMLENLYGKDIFENQDVTDRIKTMDDVFAETGRPFTPNFIDVPEDLRAFFQQVYDNIVIVEALNEGTVLDINSDEQRHYPYLRKAGSPASFAFYFSDYDASYAVAGSGSRLTLKNSKLAAYYGTQFRDKLIKMLGL